MALFFCCFGDDELESMGIVKRNDSREMINMDSTSVQGNDKDSESLLRRTREEKQEEEVIPKNWFKDKRKKLEVYRSNKHAMYVDQAKKEVFPEFIVAFIEVLEMRDKMMIQEDIQMANKGKNQMQLDQIYSMYVEELQNLKDDLNEALGSLNNLGMAKDSILNIAILSIFSRGAFIVEN